MVGIGDTLTAASTETGKTGEGSVPVGLSRKGKEIEIRPDQQSSSNRKQTSYSVPERCDPRLILLQEKNGLSVKLQRKDA